VKTSEDVDVTIEENTIQNRIKELGEKITNDYKGQDLVVVGVLKGAFLFFADLVRNINLPIEVDFVSLSSYEDRTETTGNVKLELDTRGKVEGKDVLIVEDILDSGLTLDYLLNHFKNKGVRSLKIAVLLAKNTTRIKNVKVDYVCFNIENYFVVGFGLDDNEKLRELPFIGRKK
jgi:hypoxanthine phosphoribosyltransferase